MQNIFVGIYSLYSGNAPIQSALPGGLHFLDAPQDTEMAYGVYQLEGGGPEYMFDDESELPKIQFDIYAASNSDRQAAYDALIALYDDATPSATDFNPLIMNRGMQRFLRMGDQWQYFQATIIYNCRFEKQ